jgi:hypothetical protein
LDAEALAREVGGRVMGAFIRARKPEQHSATDQEAVQTSARCCGPECCQ